MERVARHLNQRRKKGGALLARLLVSYGFMTTAFVLIAFAMEGNGSASLRNPAWILVSWLRNLFVGIGVGAVGLFALSLMMTLVMAHLERQAQLEQARNEEFERQTRMQIEAEQREKKAAIEAARESAQAAERDLAQKIQAARREESRLSRSAKEAAAAAMNDFL